MQRNPMAPAGLRLGIPKKVVILSLIRRVGPEIFRSKMNLGFSSLMIS